MQNNLDKSNTNNGCCGLPELELAGAAAAGGAQLCELLYEATNRFNSKLTSYNMPNADMQNNVDNSKTNYGRCGVPELELAGATSAA